MNYKYGEPKGIDQQTVYQVKGDKEEGLKKSLLVIYRAKH